MTTGPQSSAALPVAGTMLVDDGRTSLSYEIVGTGRPALLTLHGGPGMGHAYLSPLRVLGDSDRAVVFYDQMGSGRSDSAPYPEAWTVAHYVAEVEAVRTQLDLGRVDLFGHSWGGWLALSYALEHPEHVSTLILSSTSASVAEYLVRVQALRAALGAAKHRELLRAEAAGEFESPRYLEAICELSGLHLKRSWPFELSRSMQEIDELTASGLLAFGPAYRHMWGPNEFVCDGPLLDWDVADRLGEIGAPTLVLCGLHDEVPLACSETLAAGIADNEFVIFGHSSHLTMWERGRDAYLAVIKDFLSRRATGPEST